MAIIDTTYGAVIIYCVTPKRDKAASHIFNKI